MMRRRVSGGFRLKMGLESQSSLSRSFSFSGEEDFKVSHGQFPDHKMVFMVGCFDSRLSVVVRLWCHRRKP